MTFSNVRSHSLPRRQPKKTALKYNGTTPMSIDSIKDLREPYAAASPEDDGVVHRFVRQELRRLSPEQRAKLSGRLGELADSQRKVLEDARDVVKGPKRAEAPKLELLKLVLILAVVAVLAVGYVAYWIGMIVGVPQGGQPSTYGAAIANCIRFGISALLTISLVQSLRTGEQLRSWAVMRHVRLLDVFQNALIIGLTVAVAFLLRWLCPWLDRSWLYLVPGFHSNATNIIAVPMNIKYYGIAFSALFAVCVPGFARSEELQYRRGRLDGGTEL